MWSCVKVKQIHFLRIKPFKFFWILQQNFELERVNCIIIDLLFITLQAKPFFEKVLLMGIIYYVQFAKYVFVWWFAVSVEFSDHRLLFIIICWRYFFTFPWRNSLKKDNIFQAFFFFFFFFKKKKKKKKKKKTGRILLKRITSLICSISHGKLKRKKMWIFSTLFSQLHNSKKFQIVIIQELAPEVVKFWKYQVLKININTNDRKIKECRLKKGSFILQSYFINHPHDFEFDQPNIQLKQKTNRMKCKQNKNKTKLKKNQ